MEYSKKSFYLLFIAIEMITIIVRYPIYPHELGSDAISMHGMAQSLVKYHVAYWLIHPLSYLGLYPYSYASGLHMMIASLTILTGLSMEISIMYFSIVLGLYQTCVICILSKEFLKDKLFITISLIISSIIPFFISMSYWTMETRAFSIPFFTLQCFYFIRMIKKFQWKIFGLSVINLMLILSIHNVSILIIIFYIALFLVILKTKLSSLVNKKIKNLNTTYLHYSLCALWFLIIAIFIILQIYKVGYYSKFNIWQKSQSSLYFSGVKPSNIFLGMASDYGGRFGIGVPLLIIGVIFLMKEKNSKNTSNLFILSLLIVSSPLLSFVEYISLVLIPAFSITMSFGLYSILKKSRRRIATKITTVFTICSLFFSIGMIRHWENLPSRGIIYNDNIAKSSLT